MIAALVGVQAAAGLLLHGAAAFRVQESVLVAVLAGLALWVLTGAVRGRLRVPSRAPAVWAAALAALCFASSFFAAAPARSPSVWAAAAAGLWLIPAATLLDARERAAVEQAVRAAAWALAFLAAHQRWHGQLQPPSALPDSDAFAGAVLLLLPFAVRRGDRLLAACLLACLWWTRSVGAWLGLSAALVLHRRAVGAFAFWAGAAIGAVALVAACLKLRSAQLGALLSRGYLLETAAGRGWPYLLLWLAGVAVLLRRAPADKRFGPVAALIHGIFSSALGVPGVFWLFCLSSGWAQPESEEAVGR